MELFRRIGAFYKSFRFRLLVQFTILTALTTAGFTFFYVNHEIKNYHVQLKREGKLIAEQIAYTAKLAIFAEDRPALAALLQNTLQRASVADVSISTPDGKILATAGRKTGVGTIDGMVQTVDVLADSGELTPEAALLGTYPHAEIPVIGKVHLVMETTQIHERIQHLVAVSIAIGLCFWLLVSSLAYLVLTRVTRSFNLLMDGVKVIEGGDLTKRIPLESSDEPGRAASAMNELAATLQRREEENRRLQVERDNALRLEVQEEKKRIMARLIQANKMTSLGVLVSSMAHEINNPNSTIGLSAHYLAKAWQDALPLLEGLTEEEGDFSLGGIPFSTAQHEITDCVAKISSNSERISQVVQNLRNYSVGMKSSFAPGVDINRVTAASLTMVRCYCRQTEANLKLEQETELPTITGNRQQLEQVVVNLVMNAVQALPDGRGTVVVSTASAPSAQEVLITVTDDGAGLAPEIKNRLCEPFASTRIDEGGSGLGLYISNFILSEHKGCLEFRSTPGAGTTAIIHLPVDA